METLPFSYSCVVQKVLELPLVDECLSTKGHFVYCLLSPFLTKVYVGAVGLKRPRAPYSRLREHWNLVWICASRASRRRYGQRAPELYRAVAKVGIGNAIMVLLAETEMHRLAHMEGCYIRLLSPVFNVFGTIGDDGLPGVLKRVLGSSMSEDIRLIGAALLRKNRPRLPFHVWPVLVAHVLRTGGRELAAKLARQARQVCLQLSRLRAAPRLVFPCPVPAALLKQLRAEVHTALMALPFVRRTPQFFLMMEATAVCWERSPFAEVVLAPVAIPWDRVGPCQCGALPGWARRSQGADCGRLDGAAAHAGGL